MSNTKLNNNEDSDCIRFLNFPLWKMVTNGNLKTCYLFGILPIYRKDINEGIVINDNTFIVWEPCNQSHAEVVPGYAKYLHDLGYHVSIIINPQKYKEGLFSRFSEENISYNKISRNRAKKFFKHSNLSNIKGLLVTTVGKLCDSVHYEQCFEHFAQDVDKRKIFRVEHEAKASADNGSWDSSLITLRKLNYKGINSVIVNPHYFGKINITPKNKDITNFITVGAINPKRRNSLLIINAVNNLYKKGYRNFKVTVVGKGCLKDVPMELHKYISIKGRLPFDKMYNELEAADFILTAYDENDISHQRYNTTGTSGAFQLMYGFAKPAVVLESFAPINGLDNSNSIIYKTAEKYSEALEAGINMTEDEYSVIQNNLKNTADNLYQVSLNNLQQLIEHQTGN